MKEQKSTIGIVLNSGVQVGAKCLGTPQDMEQAYKNCVANNTELRVETGDEFNRVMYIRPEEISMFSVGSIAPERDLIKPINNGIIKLN